MIRFTARDNTTATVSELTTEFCNFATTVPRPDPTRDQSRPHLTLPSPSTVADFSQFLVLFSQTHKSFLFINIVRFWLRLFFLFVSLFQVLFFCCFFGKFVLLVFKIDLQIYMQAELGPSSASSCVLHPADPQLLLLLLQVVAVVLVVVVVASCRT